MAQVIVYAGAIMVLFVFVIMLLNAGAEAKRGRSLAVQLLGVPGFFGLLALLSYAILRLFPTAAKVGVGRIRTQAKDTAAHSRQQPHKSGPPAEPHRGRRPPRQRPNHRVHAAAYQAP